MNKTMCLRLLGLKLPPTASDQELALLKKAVSKVLGLAAEFITEIQIVRKSLDARKRQGNNEGLSFVYIIDVKTSVAVSYKTRSRSVTAEPIPAAPHFLVEKGVICLKHRPVVVGAGPAGLFAALLLAQNGYCPLLVERGKQINERAVDVRRFWRDGLLEPESNVQFGAGGAGAFSDGKLTSRSKDPLSAWVLNEMAEAGAPADCLYLAKPHIGSDKLLEVTANLINKIKLLGGEVIYQSRLDDMHSENGKLCALLVGNKMVPTDACVLAIGHSSRDTYHMLFQHGVAMSPKGFAMGLRVQHPQKMINKVQYGSADNKLLGAADYALRYRHELSGRGVYSFCMCPGGAIVNAASEVGGVVTNGISNSARDSAFANSAIVVQVEPSDFGLNPLDGMAWQRDLEQAAFAAGGSTYALPAQSVTDFLAGRKSAELPADFAPYTCSVTPADLREFLPTFVSEALADALGFWQRQIDGFATSGVLAGVETRTSAPLRILRNEQAQSITIKGLYPAGEGAGYAGGIVSSAIDGLHAALSLMADNAPAAE